MASGYEGDDGAQPRGSKRRFGSGFALGGLIGLLGGVAYGWWSAGGPVPQMPDGFELPSPPVRSAPAPQAVEPETQPVAAPVVDSNQAALRAALARGDGLTIGVFGDSMADGLWAGLYRELQDMEDVRLVRLSQPSTGLARYDYVNVQNRTAEQLGQQRIDIAVFLIGTNDRQAMQGDGQVHAYGEPSWREAYGRRVDALAGLARERGAAVYWVGLPRMRSERAEAGAELVNDIFAARAEAGGFPFIDTAPVTSDANMEYAAYLPTGPGGARQLARAQDGIHMTMNGYLVLARPLEEQLRADIEEARAAVAGPSATATPPSGPASDA